MSNHLQIIKDPLDVNTISNQVTSPSTGATSVFIGTTRDHFDGKTVLRLEYEAYVPMAKKELQKLCTKVRAKWSVKDIAIHHRIGVVPVTEASVVIAISSEHRRESLEAVHFAIDELKATVPIWKKEVYEGESKVWKANKECQWANGNVNPASSISSSSSSCSEDEIDERFVQVVAPKAEIDRRIQAFIERKREEINNSNVLEFCNRHVSETNEYSCARTDAVLHRQKGSSSHLRQTRVINAIGPQTEGEQVRDHASMLQNASSTFPGVKQEAVEEEDELPDGIKDRMLTLEKKLILEPNKPIPKDIYARIKGLEEQVRYLEGMSPEYFDLFNARLDQVKLEPNSDSTGHSNEVRREDLAKSLTGLNSRIQELQASLRVKSEPMDS